MSIPAVGLLESALSGEVVALGPALLQFEEHLFYCGQSRESYARRHERDAKTHLNKLESAHAGARPHADQWSRGVRADPAKFIVVGELHADCVGARFDVCGQTILYLRQ